MGRRTESTNRKVMNNFVAPKGVVRYRWYPLDPCYGIPDVSGYTMLWKATSDVSDMFINTNIHGSSGASDILKATQTNDEIHHI